MPIEVARLIDSINPEKTVLLFGAGSSVPSGIPIAARLASSLAATFSLDAEGYLLSEITSLIEQRYSRRELVEALRMKFKGVQPTGGLMNLPLYRWKSLYTTNYDDLIEQCYRRLGRDLIVYSSNFDFTIHDSPEATKLFKLHGTIEKDISDGHASRLIITETDYDQTGNYRDSLYDRLKGDMAGGHLVIIGHSLQDGDIREVVNRAAELGLKTPGAWKISLLLYTRDENRAQLFEKRGFAVCFGGIDEFFAELAHKHPDTISKKESEDPLDAVPFLRATTIDVAHALGAVPNFSDMYNGWPATHADILAGFTFERNTSEEIDYELRSTAILCAILLGASGVGKTTAARQAIQRMQRHGYLCWEHRTQYSLTVRGWVDIARGLAAKGRMGVLIIDDAHVHLQLVSDLIDTLVYERLSSLKLLCVSTRNQWNPRQKSPNLFKQGKEFKMARLQPQEIERLLNLVDSSSAVRAVVEETFSGFSRYERHRRLVHRCESEMFVCLKNIFASEKFDDIILREYADLDPISNQEIYRAVAALESAGIRVHRQLVIRLLGIPAEEIRAALVHLTDIIHEQTVSEREGIYSWRSRHKVIASIIARYKYADADKLSELFALVIDNTSPTYEVEVLSMRELCNVESGIPSIPDKTVQNTLLRKMMSIVPGERVPRHRLIRNLIEMGEFEKADTEIRIFEKDFVRGDAPVARYKVSLLTTRAKMAPGIMEEDRLVILNQARALAMSSIRRFPSSKSLLIAYCEVGLEIYRRTGEGVVYDEAIAELRAAEEEQIGDPDIPRLIARYESRIRGYAMNTADAGYVADIVEEELVSE